MKIDPNKIGKRIIIGQSVLDTVGSLKKLELLSKPEIISGSRVEYESVNSKLIAVESMEHFAVSLDLKNGYNFDKKVHYGVFGYDESIMKYSALEGRATNVSYALISMNLDSYDVVCEIDSIFVSKSSDVCKQIKGSVCANRYDIGTTTNREVAIRKKKFLEKYVPADSIVLIDGPILAGDGLIDFIPIVESKFLLNNIISIFVVKNSNSSLLCDSWPEFKGRYNSDLHMIHVNLRAGQRTPFYVYTDEQNDKLTKAFCYIKFREHFSPIRVEIPTKIYYKCVDNGVIDDLMDLLLYYIMVQGSNDNPQPRPIAIAELYARESLSVVELNDKYNASKLTQTMNERRGMFEE